MRGGKKGLQQKPWGSVVMILLPDAWDFVEHWCDPPENLPRCRFQGDVFKGLRLARGITQAQAASWFGVSRRTICDWELGRFVPGRCHLKRICVKFACPYWCLVAAVADETYHRQRDGTDGVRGARAERAKTGFDWALMYPYKCVKRKRYSYFEFLQWHSNFAIWIWRVGVNSGGL